MDLVITLFLIILVLSVAWWGAHRIGQAFGLPPQILVVLEVLIVFVGLLLILNALGLGARLGLTT